MHRLQLPLLHDAEFSYIHGHFRRREGRHLGRCQICWNAPAMKSNKDTLAYTLTLGLIAGACAALVSCDVDKTEDGSVPKVKVEGEAKLPKYEVHGPEVTVEKKKVEVEVPKVKVDIPEEEEHEPAKKP
jgi:hypothetical protein